VEVGRDEKPQGSCRSEAKTTEGNPAPTAITWRLEGMITERLVKEKR